MDTLGLVLYNLLVIPVLWIALRIVAVWNDKVRRGLRGRRLLFSSLRAKLALRGTRPTFWVHVASMGEFEQAKPILERLKQRSPDVFVLVSFFSPSGFDHSQDYSFADAVVYLPFDSYLSAGKFVAIVRPVAVLFVRYELWLNHLHAIHAAGIPLYLACTSARSYERASPVVRLYYASAYRNFSTVCCIDESDREVFLHILGDSARCVVTGDTRYDRVIERAHDSRDEPPLPANLVDAKSVFVAGSTWDHDEPVLFPAIAKAIERFGDSFLAIIAPHEPREDNLRRIESQISCCRLSRIASYAGEPALLVDSIGQLFSLYQYASIAYVGGGFGAGVHSVLEPAAFGARVVFGPRCDRAPETRDLIASGGGAIVQSPEALIDELLSYAHSLDPRAAEFVAARAGASDRIVQLLAI